MSPLARTALARVLRSVAATISALSPLERDLRVLASTLDDRDPQEPKHPARRAKAEPRSTVEFTAIDSKKAERALSRLGIRSES